MTLELQLTIPDPKPPSVSVTIPGPDSLSGARATRLGAAVPFSQNVQPTHQVIAQATDWQDKAEAHGWRIPINLTPTHAPILRGDLPPHALDTGGVIDISATGLFTPVSGNAQLYMQVEIDGRPLASNTVVRDDKPGGSIAATGWGFSNGFTGANLMRSWFGPDTRWWFELQIMSLGKNAASVHPHKDPVTSQLRFRGRLVLGELINGYGLQASGLAISLGGDWAPGQSYAVVTTVGGQDGPASRVELHGRHYICVADHVAADANKPGEGADWRSYWRPSFIECQIFNEIDLDIADEGGHSITLLVGGPWSNADGDDSALVESAQITVTTDPGGYYWQTI